MSDIPLDEVIHFDVISSSSTGAAVDADSTPTFAVYEEATDTDIGVGGNLTKRTSLTGNYRGSFTASAANGFELGKWYAVIASATVEGIVAKAVAMRFRIVAAEVVAGYPATDTLKVGGTTQTAGDLAALINTVDDFLDTEVAAIKAKTDNLPSDPADQSAVEAAITAATSPLATAANLATVASYLDTEIAAILADTNELQTDWADGGRLDLILDARASQSSLDALITTVGVAGAGLTAADDAVMAAIAALNNLSAAQVNSEVDTAIADAALATAANLATVAGYLDTEMAATLAAALAIKAKTDQFVFTVANQVDANALSGGGGLDAAGVRAAVGLAAANLDTQIAAIPTAAEIDTQLSGTHGGGAWGSSGSGSGAFTLTITVNDGATALQNATIRLVEGVNNYTAQTNASGVATFSLDAATYSVAITKAGYSFTPTTKVVTATGSQTYSMTAFTITPSDPGQVTGYLYAYATDGNVASGVVVSLVQIKVRDGSTGAAFNGTRRTCMSAVDGLVEFPGMIPGGRYKLWRGTTQVNEKEFTIPVDAEDPYELPSVVSG